MLSSHPEVTVDFILFDRFVSRRSVEGLLTELRMPGAPSGVFVDSPGGHFEFFSVLGPAIERKGITMLAGDVRSAAVILFLLGHDRQVVPDSSFFFHEVRTLVRGEEITIADLEAVEEYTEEMSGRPKEEYQEWVRQMNSAQDWFVEFISRKTGLSRSLFLNLMRSEATLSSGEAIHYGIANRAVSYPR